MSPAVSKAARDTSARAAPSVIVIGGGFCGVTAARELGQRGYDVTLLEARNRLGGRTFTAEFAGEATDMGGTWIHWQQPHVWSEMQRYGLKLKETPGAQLVAVCDVNEDAARARGEEYGVPYYAK